jgi:hypothetical protein
MFTPFSGCQACVGWGPREGVPRARPRAGVPPPLRPATRVQVQSRIRSAPEIKRLLHREGRVGEAGLLPRWRAWLPSRLPTQIAGQARAPVALSRRGSYASPQARPPRNTTPATQPYRLMQHFDSSGHLRAVGGIRRPRAGLTNSPASGTGPDGAHSSRLS